MKDRKAPYTLVYIMGAGRSGTTALTTFLGNNKDSLSLADLIVFYDYICENRITGDGSRIRDSRFWQPVLERLPQEVLDNACGIHAANRKIEHHPAVPWHLLHAVPKEKLEQLLDNQEMLLDTINEVYPSRFIIDSSKYVGRAFCLLRSRYLNLKVIYNVRDLRGVLWSFQKKVQTTRKPLSALLYYAVVNLMAELAYRVFPKDKVLKVRYEDVMDDPAKEFARIGEFLDNDYSDVIEKIRNDDFFEVGPIIEGNRMREMRKVKFKKDHEWQDRLSPIRKIAYYLAAWPLMIINGYSIRGN